jgi:hypothetical protein
MVNTFLYLTFKNRNFQLPPYILCPCYILNGITIRVLVGYKRCYGDLASTAAYLTGEPSKISQMQFLTPRQFL